MVSGRTFALGCHRCSGHVGPTGARRARRRLDGLSARAGVSIGMVNRTARPGRYCIRLSRVFTSAVSWPMLHLAGVARDDPVPPRSARHCRGIP